MLKRIIVFAALQNSVVMVSNPRDWIMERYTRLSKIEILLYPPAVGCTWRERSESPERTGNQ